MEQSQETQFLFFQMKTSRRSQQLLPQVLLASKHTHTHSQQLVYNQCADI